MRLRVIACSIMWVAAVLPAAAALSPANDATPEVQLDQIRTLERAQEYEKAMALAERLLPEAITQDWRSAKPYLLDDIARIALALGNQDRADEASAQALALARATFGKQSTKTAYFSARRGFSELALGHCERASASFFDAYKAYRNEERYAQRARNLRSNLWTIASYSGDPFAKPYIRELFPEEDLLPLQWRIDLATSRRQFERAEVLLRQANSEQLDVRLKQAQLAKNQSKLNEAMEIVLEVLGDSSDELMQNSALSKLASIYNARGQATEAALIYDRILDSTKRRNADQMPEAADKHQGLGASFILLGDYQRAIPHFTQAIRIYSKCLGENSGKVAINLSQRAFALFETGDVAKAATDMTRALETFASLGEVWKLREGFANVGKGAILAQLGDTENAIRHLQEGAAEIESQLGSVSSDLPPSQLELAEIYMRDGSFDTALEHAGTAVEIRSLHGAKSGWGLAKALDTYARILSRKGEDSEALEYSLRAVVELQNRLLAREQASFSLNVSEQRHYRSIYEHYLEFADTCPSSSADTTWFRAMQSVHTGIEALALTRVADSADPGAVRKQLALEARKRELGIAWITATAQTRREIEKEQKRVERNLVKVKTQFENNDASVTFSPFVSTHDIRNVLEPDEAMYMQTVTATGTYGVLVTNDGFLCAHSELDRNLLRRHATKIRQSLNFDDFNASKTFAEASAHALYRGSVGHFESQLKNVDHLIMVLDDAFQSVPPHVLITAPGRTENEAPRYLVEDLSLSITPSASAFVSLRRMRKPPAEERKRFLGFGAPNFVAQSTPLPQGGGTRRASEIANTLILGSNTSAIASLEPLPETKTELEEIQKLIGEQESDIYLGAMATEGRVKGTELVNYRLISFATHALVAGEFHGLAQPALVLSAPEQPSRSDDGILTASEISQLSIDSDWVLLSACNTGVTDNARGAEGLSSLTNAFFLAGAHSLLVSHWAVSSSATVPLIVNTIRNWEAGAGDEKKSEALRQAMLSMLNGEHGAQFTHPVYWGPFVIVGDSG